MLEALQVSDGMPSSAAQVGPFTVPWLHSRHRQDGRGHLGREEEGLPILLGLPEGNEILR